MKDWTLFLDRDGVINCRLLDDYVKQWREFTFCPGSCEALALLSQHFFPVVVVTNQRGIARGLMSEQDLQHIHHKMCQEITQHGGRIDAIYFCPDERNVGSKNRKPEIGMALQAQHDFPQIDFQHSIMVGDSLSDLEFGRRAGMKTVLISQDRKAVSQWEKWWDFHFPCLYKLAENLEQFKKTLKSLS